MVNETRGLVSIIVPVYNIEEYVSECIESILKQQYRFIEVIIVDDGSTDSTLSVCEEYKRNDDRINVIHKDNGGVVSARQTGIEAARGEFVVFVDGDDWIEPDMISTMLNGIGSADLISTGVLWEKDVNKVYRMVDRFDPGLYEKSDLCKVYSKMLYDKDRDIMHPLTSWIYNKMYRLSLAKEIHRELDTGLSFAEDSVFLYKYILRCDSFIVLHSCHYHYRYRPGSAIHKMDNLILDKINNVYQCLFREFKKHDEKYGLVSQLQRWVLVRCCTTVGELMHFDDMIHIQRYIADTKGLDDKRIILYGGGKVGQDYYTQLKKFDYNIVSWVDRKPDACIKRDMVIVGINNIARVDYDIILIAVLEEEIADAIKSDLIKLGVNEQEIIWNQPMRLY